MFTVSFGVVVFILFIVFMFGMVVGSYKEWNRPITKEELIALDVAFNGTKTGRVSCDRPNSANIPKGSFIDERV